jgi:mono/diheme cytochrome c family protein
LDFGAFQEFLFECAKSPRFNASEILREIEKTRKLGFVERMVYRAAIIPQTRKTLLKEEGRLAWTADRPPAGPGRTDAFNLLKINILNLPDDGSIAASDYLPLWNQKAREHVALHWNGSGAGVREENLISAFSVVGAPKGLEAKSFDRLSRFLADLPPPSFPFEISSDLAERGRVLYQSHCAACHEWGSSGIGKITPAEEIGTDKAFLAMMTPEFVDALRAIDRPPFKFTSVRITDGYVNIPLDGCWLRAPYLHNGSVPTLADLLAPPDQRPARFSRGGNTYDPERMGFRGEGPTQIDYDTSLPGNGNEGHSYGTGLKPEEKRALMEFLKTL